MTYDASPAEMNYHLAAYRLKQAQRNLKRYLSPKTMREFRAAEKALADAKEALDKEQAAPKLL